MAYRTRVPLGLRITIATTFDWTLFASQDVPRIAEGFEEYTALCRIYQLDPGHLGEQALTLHQITQEWAPGSYRGICWNQTSVNVDAWRRLSSETESDQDQPYNIFEEKRHHLIPLAKFESEAKEL